MNKLIVRLCSISSGFGVYSTQPVTHTIVATCMTTIFLNSNLTNSTEWWNFQIINLQSMCRWRWWRQYNDMLVINRFFVSTIGIAYFLIACKNETKTNKKFKVGNSGYTKTLSFHYNLDCSYEIRHQFKHFGIICNTILTRFLCTDIVFTQCILVCAIDP